MSQSGFTVTPAAGSTAERGGSDPTLALATPQEGMLLVKTFLRIRSPERRQAVIKYAADVANLDESERVQ
jgi:hypothetical protein